MMTVKKCPFCAEPIQLKAIKCKHCGEMLNVNEAKQLKVEKKSQNESIGPKMFRGCLVVVLGFFIICVILGLISGLTTSSSKPEAGLKIPTLGKQIVTFAEYKQIQTGMRYQQVKGIIGYEGEEISRNNVAGYSTVMYQWVNYNGSSMNAMFQNGRLIQKAQLGLK